MNDDSWGTNSRKRFQILALSGGGLRTGIFAAIILFESWTSPSPRHLETQLHNQYIDGGLSANAPGLLAPFEPPPLSPIPIFFIGPLHETEGTEAPESPVDGCYRDEDS